MRKTGSKEFRLRIFLHPLFDLPFSQWRALQILQTARYNNYAITFPRNKTPVEHTNIFLNDCLLGSFRQFAKTYTYIFVNTSSFKNHFIR